MSGEITLLGLDKSDLSIVLRQEVVRYHWTGWRSRESPALVAHGSPTIGTKKVAPLRPCWKSTRGNFWGLHTDILERIIVSPVYEVLTRVRTRGWLRNFKCVLEKAPDGTAIQARGLTPRRKAAATNPHCTEPKSTLASHQDRPPSRSSRSTYSHWRGCCGLFRGQASSQVM